MNFALLLVFSHDVEVLINYLEIQSRRVNLIYIILTLNLYKYSYCATHLYMRLPFCALQAIN